MRFLEWILNPFCRHQREILRRRDDCLGLECVSCFRWRALDQASPYAQVPSPKHSA